MSRSLIIARRDLGALFQAPVAYVTGVLFLVMQGFSFWAVVAALSDPREPVAYGAVLHTHFGGTLLYWAINFAVIAVVSMRLCAEEKRHGSWEALVTTGASEWEILLGKWLAGLSYYGALWLPTLAFPLVVSTFSASDVGLDLGPVIAAYAGVFITGAGFIAVGVAASVSTSSQMAAAVATFAILMAFLFIGQIPELALTDEGAPSAADVVDVRAHMDAFARGVVDVTTVLVHVALILIGLVVADAIAIVGRRPRRELARRGVTVGLVSLVAVLGVTLSARHPLSFDLSRNRVNSLDAATEQLLAGVNEPVELLVIRPGADEFLPIYEEVDRILQRMQRAQPLILRRDIDPALHPDRVQALSLEFATPPEVFADGGAVVFQRGRRRRAVDLLAMAAFGRDELGAGAMANFRAEEAFAAAIADVSYEESTVLCHTTGHGEMELGGEREEVLGASLAERLVRDGTELRPLDNVRDGVPEECAALLILGPAEPLPAEEALTVAKYLADGGRLFLTLASRPEESGAGRVTPATGLEVVLSEYGLRLPPAIVVDPDREIDIPLAWMTTDGYGEHSIGQAFQGRRVSVWLAPRPVLGGEPLVSPSPLGWGERDVVALGRGNDVAAGEGDVLGAPAIAAAAERGGSRVVVFGSTRSLSNLLTARGFDGAVQLAAASVAWLTGRRMELHIGAKTPERVRLVMTPGQRWATLFGCTVAIPAALALFGLFVIRRRRRV